MTQVARRNGRLVAGGEPDFHAVAVGIINDWQRGKLPFYMAPPPEEEDDDEAAAVAAAAEVVEDEDDSLDENEGLDEEDAPNGMKPVFGPELAATVGNEVGEEERRRLGARETDTIVGDEAHDQEDDPKIGNDSDSNHAPTDERGVQLDWDDL